MNKLPPCDHDCCPPTHCELDRLKADNAKLRDLLGSTVELLESVRDYQRYQQPHLEKVTKELTRLRAREGAK